MSFVGRWEERNRIVKSGFAACLDKFYSECKKIEYEIKPFYLNSIKRKNKILKQLKK